MRRFAATKILLTLSFSFGLGGCVANETEAEQAEADAERGPLGKADAPGSCAPVDGVEFCGGQSDGACWCDEACSTYGDCCGDKQPVCDGVIPDTELCMSDATCGDGQMCDHTGCFSNCPPGGICPAVCWGACVEIPQPPQCPDICEAVCAGEPEPELPQGCPTPSCQCDDAPGQVGDACSLFAGPCEEGLVCDFVCPFDADPCPNFGINPSGFCAEELPANSCEGHCGGAAADESCYCDDACEGYGDCCEDVEEMCAEPVVDCEEIVADVLAETAAIRSCTADAECGQVLAGTSCGCSNNWVARTDADISNWEALWAEAAAAGCNIPGGISTCDCPFTDGFECTDAGTCSFNYQ